MIRLRDERGNIIETEKPPRIIELCSSDGKVARLFVDTGETLFIFGPKDKELQKHCQEVGTEVAEEIVISNRS